jgi:hypothetical protein
MDSGFLTLSDIAGRLGILESSARFYVDRFEAYIPGHEVDEDEEVVYRPEAVEIIGVIHDLFSRDHRPSEIEARLARLYPRTVRVDDGAELMEVLRAETTAISQQLAGVVLPVLVRQTQAMERLADSVDRLSSREEEIAALKRTADALTKLADKEEEPRALRAIADAVTELARDGGAQPDSAVLERTASALESLVSRDKDIKSLESQLQELKKLHEAVELKRRIMEARRDREQREYYKQTEERIGQLLSRNKRPWWKFWR